MTTWCSCWVYDEDWPLQDRTEQPHNMLASRSLSTKNVLSHGESNTLCHSAIHTEYNPSCHSGAYCFSLLVYEVAYNTSHLISLWLHLTLESIWCVAEKQQNTASNHWCIEVHQALIHCWINWTDSVKRRETRWSSSCPWQPDASVEIGFDP